MTVPTNPTMARPRRTGTSLIAAPKGPEQYAGAGLLESGTNLHTAITDGIEKGEWNAIALNPLGELVKARYVPYADNMSNTGVGKISEHTGTIAAKEALKSWKDFQEEL